MKFNYQARTKTGKVQVGTVEAASEEGALMLLQRHGLYVTHLESVEELPFWLKKIDLRRVSRKDLVMFSRQLSIMFESQVPLVEALRTLAEQSEKPRFREILTDISEKIEGGTSFSQALAAYPELFNPFFINMVKSGESSGKLAESLSYLAEHIEREYELSAKIKGAMIYPIIIVCMMAGIGILMSVYVLPQLLVILQETGQELPFITRAIISGVEFIRSWGGVALIIGFFVALIALYKFSKTKKGKDRTDRILLKMPVIGKFTKMICVSRFAENLSTLVSGGLPIAKALEITGSVVGNVCYKEAIEKTTQDVRKGEKISSGLKKYPDLFPPVLTTMVLVGEKTGSLDTALMNIVKFYRMEIDRELNNLLRLLEPLLILILGAGVGIMIGAILIPLYQTITAI